MKWYFNYIFLNSNLNSSDASHAWHICLFVNNALKYLKILTYKKGKEYWTLLNFLSFINRHHKFLIYYEWSLNYFFFVNSRLELLLQFNWSLKFIFGMNQRYFLLETSLFNTIMGGKNPLRLFNTPWRSLHNVLKKQQITNRATNNQCTRRKKTRMKMQEQ